MSCNNSSIKLSVIIPLFNDQYYIEQCLKSVLTNKSKELEILISDDHSNDNSLELISSFDDDRIRIITTPKPLGAGGNWSYALLNAKGQYVYFLAGDDYLIPGVLDIILIELDGVSVYTAPILCFDDHSFEIIDEQATPEIFNQMFDQKDSYSYQMLNWMNHDELVLSFLVRDKLKIVADLVPYSINSVFWYWVFIAFHETKVKNIPDQVLYKRYHHRHLRESWNNRSVTTIPNILVHSILFRSIADIINRVLISKHFRSILMLKRLLCANHVISGKSGGIFGLFPKSDKFYYTPSILIIIVLSIPLSIAKQFKKIMQK
jgi:glycosyltransferase involved in cell wall biosynthesis